MSPPTPSRVQAVLDGTGIVGGHGPYPPYSGSFYGQPGVHPNGEFLFELRPVEGLTIAANFGVGNNYIATQSYGWQHGYPLDLTQAYLEYCRGIFCMRAGREYETMGVETVRPDQRDFTIVSPNFSLMPFTRSMVSIGLVSDQATWRIGVSRGPDNIADTTRSPWGFTYFSYTGTKASFFTNFQAGPGEPGDARHVRINSDVGITYDPLPALRLGIYGLFSAEESPTSGWQYTAGGNFYLRARREGSPIAGVVRLGITHDDGLRAGTLTDLAQMSGGINVYAADWLQFRFQGDLLVSMNGSRPFDGQQVLPRATLQIIINPFAEF